MSEGSAQPAYVAVNAARRAVREKLGQTHGELLRAARRRKLDDMFRGRVFDIVKVVDLPEGKVFVTFLGNKARHGFVLRARDNGEEVAVGHHILKRIHDDYLAVSLPPRLRWRIWHGLSY